MKVVFMGTPEFSVPTLQKLIANENIEIVAVYTRQPAKAKRGQKVIPSAIHQLALQHDLQVVTPASLRNDDELQKFKSFQADFAVVVAYGLILPEDIIESTKFGCINLHPSLLPKYRGATPIQSTLLQGDKIGGVSIIQMDKGVDSGDILLQQEYQIDDGDDFNSLAGRFSDIGGEMILKTLAGIEQGSIKPIKQDDQLATLSKKILKTDANIDFNDKTSNILNKIRALSGFMTAFFEFKGEKIKIFQARELPVGEVDQKFITIDSVTINKDFVIKCSDGYLQPQTLQKPGKKPVTIKDFLLGNRSI